MPAHKKSAAYLHCVCLLAKKAPAPSALKKALAPFGKVSALDGEIPGFRVTGKDLERHLGAGCSLHIDVIDHPWDDGLGKTNPKLSPTSPWTIGEFGFCAYPGALVRAAEQGFHFPKAAQVVDEHRAFVRIRVVAEIKGLPARPKMGAGKLAVEKFRKGVAQAFEKAFTPQDRLVQLFLVANISLQSLFKLPGMLAWFVPGGEKLGDRKFLADRTKAHGIDLMVQTRQVQNQDGEVVVDTCGAAQLGLPDLESIVPMKWRLRKTIENFHLNALQYMVDQNAAVLADGDTIPEGPGGRWIAQSTKSSLVPPRAVVQLARVPK